MNTKPGQGLSFSYNKRQAEDFCLLNDKLITIQHKIDVVYRA